MSELQRHDFEIKGSGVKGVITVIHKMPTDPKDGLTPLAALRNWTNLEGMETYTNDSFVEYIRSQGYEAWTIEERRFIISKQNEGINNT